MQKAAFAVAVCLTLLVTNVVGQPLELFVATDGNDKNSGISDNPLANVQAALDTILERLKKGTLSAEQGAVVTIRGGTYFLDSPLELDFENAKSKLGPLIFKAAEGETVQLSGARAVTGFTAVSAPEILERLVARARGKVVVADLRSNGIEDYGKVTARGNRLEVFFKDEPMQLARWPNEGFVKIVEVVGETAFKSHGIPGTKEGVFVYENNRHARWVNESEPWLHGYWFWDWSDSFERLEAVDTDNKTLRLTEPYHHYGYRKAQRYYALNLLCELDQPGEWYVDRKAGLLYFWPPESIEEGAVRVSVLPRLLSINHGQDIYFQGIHFTGSRDTSIVITNSNDCVIEQCTVRNSGSWGISIHAGKGCEVRHSKLDNLGEGGISLNGGNRKTLEPAQHACISNEIHRFGRLYRTYRPGIGVSGVGQRVAHNLIYDGPHNAIQLSGNEHVIEYNEIHTVCYETGDVGAFYMGRDWSARGTVIRHNFFHDIQGPGLHGAMGVYLDDAASGIQVIGNIFLRSGRAVLIGGGRDNLVENNIFVECKPSVHVDARGIGWMRSTVEGTLPDRLNAMPYQESPWKERYPELLTLLEDEPGCPKGNVIRQNISLDSRWLDIEEKAKPFVVLEKNLVDVEPQFVNDPRKVGATVMDFELQDNSSALEQGFQAIPVERIGLIK